MSFKNTITSLQRGLTRCRLAWQALRASPQVRFIADRLTQYAYLARLDRPIGIYLLLWPALWAIWMASEGNPNISVLTIITLGTIVMRSAGCAINDYADRNIDAHVKRTQNRPLARGAISPREALGVFTVLALCAFGLVLLLNRLTVQLAFVGIVLVIIYPFSKRFTYMPQAFLGITFAWAVPMAWAAQTGALSKTTWLLYFATVLWIFAYDTLYAMVDRDDDIKLGVKSTAILFGNADVPIVMLVQTTVLGSLALLGQQAKLGDCYYAGLGIAAGLLIYQYFLIRHRERAKCFKAFLNNHYFGMAVFGGMLLHYWVQ